MVKKKKNKDELAIDVLSHKIVPKMEILPDNEKTKVLNKYNIDETLLPKISLNDAAVVVLKAELGNVIKITRDDGTGKYVYYRVVVG